MKKRLLVIAVLFSSLSIEIQSALAVPGVEVGGSSAADSINQAEVETLIKEAQDLFLNQHPIDARAKLQKALQLNPNDFRPHLWLGQYYLVEVGHFQLAFKYLKTSEDLFEKQFGTNIEELMQGDGWRQHAIILRLLSEAYLNLDDYEGSLKTLDRFVERYWGDWYPGSRAWVLMKLRRIDEAIQVAQAGLMRGAELDRTYNILGILLSISGNREMSLKAFAQSIRAELLNGGNYVGTPLNNAGEVYSELFKDSYAEAAWRKAISMPDGCEHILPSLNLARLYLEHTRLFGAERVLADFESCFAKNAVRSDTEHRALIALARGQIEMAKGDIDAALIHLNQALDRRQWFGKIGTTGEDLQFAIMSSMALGLRAKALSLQDESATSIADYFRILAQKNLLIARSWWYAQRAREVAVEDLADFEDLSIRHTDAMITYGTLGTVTEGFPLASFKKRIERMKVEDTRADAQNMYDLYLSRNLMAHGEYQEAIEILSKLVKTLRPIDRLARAETLASLLACDDALSPWFFGDRPLRDDDRQRYLEELVLLLPSAVRYHEIKLPVTAKIQAHNEDAEEILQKVQSKLLSGRFELVDEEKAAFTLVVSSAGNADGNSAIQMELLHKVSNTSIARMIEDTILSEAKPAELANKFTKKAFSHRQDPGSEPLPTLDFIEGLL